MQLSHTISIDCKRREADVIDFVMPRVAVLGLVMCDEAVEVTYCCHKENNCRCDPERSISAYYRNQVGFFFQTTYKSGFSLAMWIKFGGHGMSDFRRRFKTSMVSTLNR